jgi:hypothetical protein
MIGGEIAFQGQGATDRGEYRQAAGAIFLGGSSQIDLHLTKFE